MVSKDFPKGHFKEGSPTYFGLSIKYYDKIHTIRANYDLWAKRFEKIDKGLAQLSIRNWDGKPYKSKQLEIFRFDKTHGIGLEKLEWIRSEKHEGIEDKQSNVFIPNISDMKSLAKNDGLSCSDFKSWFDGKIQSEKPMAIIHFTSFRYHE